MLRSIQRWWMLDGSTQVGAIVSTGLVAMIFGQKPASWVLWWMFIAAAALIGIAVGRGESPWSPRLQRAAAVKLLKRLDHIIEDADLHGERENSRYHRLVRLRNHWGDQLAQMDEKLNWQRVKDWEQQLMNNARA